MTIHQYFNERILTFFYKRYKFTHRSFLLFLCGLGNTISAAVSCLRPALVSFGCKVINFIPIDQIIWEKSCAKIISTQFLRLFLRLCYMPKIVYCIYMYVRVRVYECKKYAQKNFEKSRENIWLFGYKLVTLHP